MDVPVASPTGAAAHTQLGWRAADNATQKSRMQAGAVS